MNTSTEKIKANLIEELQKIFGDRIPKDQVDIAKKCVDQRVKRKTVDLYKSWYSMENTMSDVSKEMVKEKADSKIEVIFYELLLRNEIPFKFQYKITPYKVDFLISDFLVLEIDGPMHLLQQEYDERRTEYIKGMGYEVMRVPINILAMGPEVIIEEIKERLKLKGIE